MTEFELVDGVRAKLAELVEAGKLVDPNGQVWDVTPVENTVSVDARDNADGPPHRAR